MPTVTIREAVSEAEVAAAFAVRFAVFVEEQGVSEADELDGTDAGAVHVIAEDPAGQVIGVARYHRAGTTVKIGRVCVLPAARGAGHGAALISHICETSGAERAELGAQVAAEAFYRRLGFQPRGAVFDDAGIPHRWMTKTLA